MSPVRALCLCYLMVFTSLTAGLTLTATPSMLSAQPSVKVCAELMPLYTESLKHLKAAQGAYLKAGCQEASEEPECKRLELSGREIMSTLQMFAMRLQASGCDPNATAQPLSECERAERLIKKTSAQIKELTRQAGAQRCEVRPHAPPCRALKEERQKQVKVERAAHTLKRRACEEAPPQEGAP